MQKKNIVVAVTGGTGTMGRETVREILDNLPEVRVKLLVENYAVALGRANFARLKWGKKVEIVHGDIRNYKSVKKLVEGADYVLHMCALIPPLSDGDVRKTWKVNLGGTKNVVNAIKALGGRATLVHISSVAVYGNRNMMHPWGRVGDPLMPAVFDSYGASKLAAERVVLEAGLEKFAVLRQTGILHSNLLINNIKDGLMFHTPWNEPIEWVTARDSGKLMRKILERDMKGEVPLFWNRVYNIGGGAGTRVTGYETFDAGFGVIGGSVKTFFEPHWNATRNFHCFWFADSDVLEEMFGFRSQGTKEFWAEFKKEHPLYSVGKIIPPELLGKMVIKPLLKDKNAPMQWVKTGNNARVLAAFGRSYEWVNAARHGWNDAELVCKQSGYEWMKAHPEKFKLNYGFDIDKPLDMVTFEDVKNVAALRGGKCLAEGMATGDLWKKLKFRCAEGHEFELTPYSLIVGHWCPLCACPMDVWQYDKLRVKSEYHAQIWRDSHDEDERYIYKMSDGKFTAEEVNV